MQMLVLSDLHLGKGKFLSDGSINLLEDFDEDEKFSEFIDHHCTGTYYFTDIHLVLNGDIFNLIQMDIDGVFHHYLTEDVVVKMVEEIIEGHPVFFQALRKFLSRPNKKITYVIGNHDFPMIWPKAQEAVNKELDGVVNFTHQLVEHGILVEHGHRFEPINTVPRSQYFTPAPNGEDMVNLPWASLFCIYLLPELKKERPYIDKVRPLSSYVKWSLLHDTRFFIKLLYTVLIYLFKTRFKKYTSTNKNFKISWKILKQISIHPKYTKNAKRIFATRPDVQVVIMGHTHVVEWRKFKGGKYYFNTGTWNSVPSVDAGMHKHVANFTYVMIDVDEKKKVIKNAFMNVWQGKWKPFREEVSTSLIK